MIEYDIAFVGTGKPRGTEDATGFGMAHKHAEAYGKLEECRFAACVDLVHENAQAFAEMYDIPGEHAYVDYKQMLRAVEPDIVSVCVPPAVHAELVLGCIHSGVVDAVHCEKPMATDWDDCQEMVAAAAEHDVQLTFNHQRRFGWPFREAKRRLNAGDIGELERIEFAAANLFDYGTHSFDLCNYYNDEAESEWVMGQIDYREKNEVFGVPNSTQAVVQWKYENGVFGYGSTGVGTGGLAIDCHHRLRGTDGTIEVGVGFCGSGGPPLRMRQAGDGEWEVVDCDGVGVHGPGFHEKAIEHVVQTLNKGVKSELSGENTLRGSQLIFGAWESSHRRGRVDLPLKIDSNPLQSMINSGALPPQPHSD